MFPERRSDGLTVALPVLWVVITTTCLHNCAMNRDKPREKRRATRSIGLECAGCNARREGLI